MAHEWGLGMNLIDLYSKNNVNPILIEDFPLYFDSSAKNICVSVSGGADSCLLLYMLSLLVSEHNPLCNIHVISNIRMWQTRPWQHSDSLRVFTEIKRRFSNLNYIRHENFISPEIEYGTIGPIIKDKYGNMKSGDQITTRSHAEYICFRENIDVYYSGLTKNPDVEIQGAPLDRHVMLDEHADFTLLVNTTVPVVCNPFRYSTKRDIVLLYRKLNIMDIFEITRSCEGEFEEINYKNYTPGQYVPVCNKCFWCLERKWGIDASK